MSEINFDGCRYISDVVKRYSDQLPGKILIEYTDTRNPFATIVKRMPILGIETTDKCAEFGTEDLDYKRVSIAFPLGLSVVTSIVETGDIWWPSSEDDWSTQYSIANLNADDINVDSVLLFAADLPRTNLLI